MKDFLLVFRADFPSMPKPTPEEGKAMTQKWMDWIGGIAAQNKLTDKGSSLASAGSVVKPGNIVTDGPYIETKELIGGYSVVKVATLAEATEIAKGCPILAVGGSVEVREINPM